MHVRTMAAVMAIATIVGAMGNVGELAVSAQEARATATAGALNLNAATTADLEKLPGVGPAMAARILEYRQKSGGFKKIEEILEMACSCPYLLRERGN